jgi:hypothetical protein
MMVPATIAQRYRMYFDAEHLVIPWPSITLRPEARHQGRAVENLVIPRGQRTQRG